MILWTWKLTLHETQILFSQLYRADVGFKEVQVNNEHLLSEVFSSFSTFCNKREDIKTINQNVWNYEQNCTKQI